MNTIARSNKTISMDEFLESELSFEDKLVLYSSTNSFPGDISYNLQTIEIILKKIETEDKIGFYKICKELKKGTFNFYKHHKLQEYIVYYKETKKVKLNLISSSSDLFSYFIASYYPNSTLIKFLLSKIKPNKVIIKSIFNNKLNTVEDFLINFRKSSRKDKVDLETLYYYFLFDVPHLHNISKETLIELKNKDAAKKNNSSINFFGPEQALKFKLNSSNDRFKFLEKPITSLEELNNFYKSIIESDERAYSRINEVFGHSK